MASLGRTARACGRCRRQKLRCDDTKPCTNCTRSGILCQSSEPSCPQGLKRQRPGITEESYPSRQRDPQRIEKSIHSVGTEINKNDALERTHMVTDASTMRFAQNVLFKVRGNNGNSNGTPVFIGDAERSTPYGTQWSLKDMNMPPARILWLLIDSYFDRVHWFVFLFHEPSFRRKVQELLTSSSWTIGDRGKVVVVLVVALLGLQTALSDDTWPGLEEFQTFSMDPQTLVQTLISEIRYHLLDILDDCQIEAVQVPMLLSVYYAYYASHNLAWTTSALAIRSSFALSLDAQHKSADDIMQQTRYRCWNFITVSDGFCSNIYRRQGMIDPNVMTIHILREMDDTQIDWSLQKTAVKYGPVSMLSYHMLKYKLYQIVNRIHTSLRVLTFNTPMSESDILSILQVVQRAEVSLEEWRRDCPAFFNNNTWLNSDPWQTFGDEFDCLPPSGRKKGQILLRQATILQITFDGAMMLVHRLLLECKLPDNSRRELSKFILDSIQRSLNMAAQAALRISKAPLHKLENHLAVNFACIHLFTAGAILLIAMINQPLTESAIEAKNGLVRILKVCQSLRNKNRIARHTEQLLIETLRWTLQNETTETENLWFEALRTADFASMDMSMSPVAQLDSSGAISAFNLDQWLNSSLIDPDILSAQPEDLFGGLDEFLSDKRPLDEQMDETLGALGRCESDWEPSSPNLVADDFPHHFRGVPNDPLKTQG